ncbi:MAG: NAD(P)-binding domain-containing protein [Pirellulales bacterium]|nr:NAD(P)-binding domain-containing protein [Pirellulales bacterium]
MPDPDSSTADRFCIIGAGSSGLAAAKNFREAGIPFDCLEREDDVGGNWYYGKPASSVYASTHLISSKTLTEYGDFPMPEEYPEYPSHRQAFAYLRAYADRFCLRERIEFNTSVERAAPLGDAGAGWLVRLADGRERRYRGVVIANGHNWDPRFPDCPGEFTGETLHSCQYKTPDAMRGKRVLVVGGGNSGCDLACEAAIHADAAIQSRRRNYHVLPKFFRGKPIDQCNELVLWLRLPLWLRRLAGSVVEHVVHGPAWRTGVPRPDHPLFSTHPVINSQIHHHVGHGRLVLRPDVKRFAGRRVEFVDGTTDEVDLVIYATGFKATIPFVEPDVLCWRDGAPRLFLNMFHPTRNDLFVIGLIQPDSGQWGLVDDQARLAARYLNAVQRASLKRAPAGLARFEKARAANAWNPGGGVRYLDSPRHRLEVEHYGYRRQLQRWIKRLANV